MCGIIAIVNQRQEAVDPEILIRARDLVTHRGPDASGVWSKDNLSLGHRRLAILDLSDSGVQPMQYRGLVIVYNGEIYNYLEIRRDLEKAGFSFQTHTDTEVVLAAYLHWGENCVQHFNGMWAFVLYDPERQILFCSRDRFGIKPLYYAQIGPYFCMASEIKQFGGIPAWKPAPNPLRCYEFLQQGLQDHTSETLFEGVFQLAPGTQLLYYLSSNRFQTSTWYRVEEHLSGQNFRSLGEAKEQFHTLFSDAVRLHLRSDVRVGTALSGGLDSSSIATIASSYLAGEKTGQALESVSICFEAPEANEQVYIQELIRKAKLRPHFVFPGFEIFQESWDKVTWQQDDPAPSLSILAQHLVFRKAREEGLIVMLNGQGADEILAGYDRFFLPFFRRLFREQPPTALAELLFSFWRHSRSPGSILAQLKRRFFPTGEWLNPPAGWDQSSFYRPAPEANLHQALLQQLRTGLPALLHHEDRNSMSFSVECRIPFLDYRLVEFCLSLPENLLIKKGVRKFLLREALDRELPPLVKNRYDKMAFATPQARWILQHLSWFEGELDHALENLGAWMSLDIRAKQQIRTKLLAQPERYSAEIWRLVAFERWRKIFWG